MWARLEESEISMKTIFDSKFQKEVVLVGQGELAISDRSRLLSTTLGSCIAVCLFDLEVEVGGMNHYMLPGPALHEECLVFTKAKYGINSMEMLVNELLKAGAQRERIKAKIFGGANMFSSNTSLGQKANSSRHNSVGNQNISFAQSYLQMESIPVLAQDVGGDHARKIYFDPGCGKVKLFRLRSQKIEEVFNRELQYRKKMEKEEEKQQQQNEEESIKDKLTLF